MTKALSILLAIAMTVSLAACGTAATQDGGSSATGASGSESSETTGQSGGIGQDGNILVAYFSWADNAVLAEDVDAVASPSVIPPGNVQQLAGWVQEETGGDLFSIRVTDPYPSDWDECLDRANQERGDDARPELTESVENLDQYDTIFLGYPDWWSDAPMLIYSFLEDYDWAGKTLIPFCTSGGSGFGRSLNKLPGSASGAMILEGLHVSGSRVEGAGQDIADWIGGLNLD